jgi:ribosomal protein S18 acetylase RimI-like enzyme
MSKHGLEIRAFRSEDIDQLQIIRHRAFEPVFRSFRDIVGPEIARVAFASAEADQRQHLNDLCSAETPQRVFVAILEARLVGFVSISLDMEQSVGELGLNAVDPDFAGQGIGTRLYEFAIEKMRAAGMKVATVGTGGDPSHAPARRAYQKAGFGPTVPNQWMYRTL